MKRKRKSKKALKRKAARAARAYEPGMFAREAGLGKPRAMAIEPPPPRVVEEPRVAEPILDNPRGKACGVDAYGEYKHRGGCCPGRPACRQQRKEEGLCHCAAYHYPHRSGSGRCGSPEQMDALVYGPPPRDADEAEESMPMSRGELINARARAGAHWVELRERLARTKDPKRQASLRIAVEAAKQEYDDALEAERNWRAEEAEHDGEATVAAPIAHSAAEQSTPSNEADAVPWVKLERDPAAYAAQIAMAEAHGKIDSARAVYDMLSPSLAKEDQETFLVVGVDIRGQCRGVVLVHKGARSRVSVDVPEILRTANALGGEMFIVVHNHPTTHATPSPADKSLTKAIEKAARATEQVMMDHVIIGMGEYFSFAENKLTKVAKRETRAKATRTVAAEAAEEQPPTTFYEVIAPPKTPKWLVSRSGQVQRRVTADVPLVRVSIPPENEHFRDRENLFGSWERFAQQFPIEALQAATVKELYIGAKNLRRKKGKPPSLLPASDDAIVTGLTMIDVFVGDSPVWWMDLESGPIAEATLFDLAAIKQPAVFRDGMVMPPTHGETGNLWMMTLDQWDNAAWPPESQGGPPFTKHVSVAREDRPADWDRQYVIAPQNTPQWLIPKRPAYLWGKAYPAVEVDVPEENEAWHHPSQSWSDFRSSLFSSEPQFSIHTTYRNLARGAKAFPSADLIHVLFEALQMISVRHNGSPVWWCDLEIGPVAAASLYDLAAHSQPYVIPRKELRADVIGVIEGETDKDVIKQRRKKIMQFAGKKLWLLSLQQWDDAEWPPESQGGPPFTEHVSVARDSGKK